MSLGNILSPKPIVFSSAKELWAFYAKNKFNALKSTMNVNDYYDFIFAAGSVGYWLAHEGKEPKTNIYYQIFNSIYNNTKHYELNRKRFSVYVVDNQKSLMPTDGQGNTIWTDDFILYADSIWLDKCDGESDALLLCCEIHDEKTNAKSFVMLYEVCKQVFNLYEQIFV